MTSIREQIDNSEFPMVRELLGGLYDALSAALVVPNDMLPPAYHQKKTKDVNGRNEQIKGRSIAEIEKIYQKRLPAIEKKQHDAERARRVELYKNQIEETGRIEFEPYVAGQKTREIKLT